MESSPYFFPFPSYNFSGWGKQSLTSWLLLPMGGPILPTVHITEKKDWPFATLNKIAIS